MLAAHCQQKITSSVDPLYICRYSFLQCCWLKKASERPTFTVIVDYFIRFLENEPHPDHSDLQDQEPNRPYFVLEVAEAPPSTKNSSDNSPQ